MITATKNTLYYITSKSLLIKAATTIAIISIALIILKRRAQSAYQTGYDEGWLQRGSHERSQASARPQLPDLNTQYITQLFNHLRKLCAETLEAQTTLAAQERALTESRAAEAAAQQTIAAQERALTESRATEAALQRVRTAQEAASRAAQAVAQQRIAELERSLRTAAAQSAQQTAAHQQETALHQARIHQLAEENVRLSSQIAELATQLDELRNPPPPPPAPPEFCAVQMPPHSPRNNPGMVARVLTLLTRSEQPSDGDTTKEDPDWV